MKKTGKAGSTIGVRVICSSKRSARGFGGAYRGKTGDASAGSAYSGKWSAGSIRGAYRNKRSDKVTHRGKRSTASANIAGKAFFSKRLTGGIEGAYCNKRRAASAKVAYIRSIWLIKCVTSERIMCIIMEGIKKLLAKKRAKGFIFIKAFVSHKSYYSTLLHKVK